MTAAVALIQMHCEKGAIDDNLAAIRGHYLAAAERGVAIALFPEMSLTGYVVPDRCPGAVLSLGGPEVAALVSLTHGHSTALVAGIIEANSTGRPYITQIVAAHGALQGAYRKISIEEEEADRFSPGWEYPLFTHRGLTFGVAICADIGHREVFAAYARQGATAVLVAAAPGLYGEQATRNWQSGFNWWREECRQGPGAYAAELGLPIAIATQAGRTVDEDFPGGGYLFGPDGRCLAETLDWREGVLDVRLPRCRYTPLCHTARRLTQQRVIDNE